MAEINANIDLKLSDIDSIKTLVELLIKNENALPSEIIECVSGIVNNDVFEMDIGEVQRCGFSTASVYADGNYVEKVTSCNKYLKRVAVLGGTHIFPEHMKMIASDEKTVLMEW